MPVTSNNKNTSVYTTKDESLIRERVHPSLHQNKNQSLAEAIIPAHSRTQRHYHKNSEEIYFVLKGKAEMSLNDETFIIEEGDSIVIPPRQAHNLWNPYDEDLIILCCCAPAYSHSDTVLI